jgi:hypothetical protein
MAKQTFTAGQILTAAQVTALQTNEYNQTVSAKTASYTLVAADVGTRITMSAATATTITVNTSLFAAGDTLTLTNIGAGNCTVTAGTATVSSSGSLVLRQNQSGTLYFTSAGVSIFFPTPQTTTQNAQTASYTLVAGDVGRHVTMSNAAANTVTVNTSLFVLGDQIRITNLGAGVCTITAGTCTVTGQNAEFLKLGTNASGILYFTAAATAIWLADNPGKTTAYTSAWTFSGNAITIGNGTLTGSYTVDGAFIDVESLAVWGSTTSAAGVGALYCSLPSGYNPILTSNAYAPLGNASFFQSGVARFVTLAYNDTQFNAGYVGFAATQAFPIAVVSNSSPYTQIQTSNTVHVKLRYRWSTT